jgi:tetratricopeptide (TPR) repeat protein
MTIRKTLFLIICLLLLPLLPASAIAALSRDQMHSLLGRANDAFKKANESADDSESQRLFETAILSFEKIVSDGQIKNAKLYYNLANAYLLKDQQLGKAILNYRRAENLDRANPKIQKNLSFARGRRIDKVLVKTEKRVLKTLFFWHYDSSMKTKFTLACIGFAVLCISLTVCVWFGRFAVVTVTAAIAGIVLLGLSVSVVFEASSRANRICGVIIADQVVAHQADWKDSPASFKDPLHSGTEFDLLEKRPGWLHIELADGSDGWIPHSAAELI